MTAITEPLKLSITRLLDAPRRLVWEAYTKKEHLDRWSCPQGFVMLSSEADLRPGGAWRICMRAPDGELFPASGVYQEIVPLEKLVMTHGWIDDDGSRPVETLMTITFADEGSKTRLTLEQEGFASAESRDRHVDGWGQCLDKLAGIAAVADREIVISREVDAPPELVWKAITDPAHVARWWGPVGFSTTTKTMDVRVGGVWEHVMRGPDGTEYPNRSVFTEVTPPSRLAYDHGGNKKGGPEIHFQMTWTFDALEEGRTRVTIHQVHPSPEMRDRVVREFGAIEGGRQTLGRLSEELAKEPFVIERTFDAPDSLVWKAISEPDQIAEWFAELKGFRAEVGAEAEWDCDKDGMVYRHRHRVTEVVPGKRLAYSWRYEGHEGEALVTFELFPEGGKTRLKLTHAGLETFQPEKFPAFARKNFRKGWTAIIGMHLGEFLAKQAAAR